jgi:membrane-bound ClpP family serine protease
MHGDAILGGSGASEFNSDDIDIATRSIREIMSEKSRTWSLPTSVIDPLLTVHQFKLTDSTAVDFFCEEELLDQPDPERWERQDEVSLAGKPLQVSGTRAVELRLARATVEDFDAFKQLYQLENAPELVRPNWAHELVAALASPQIAGMLLFIGGFALIAELSAPGIGIGGFISAVCFMLFFWANFLQGTAGWLEIILFAAGVFFIALEVFVLPGFGIFGLGGGTMVLVSLILASQTFIIPRNDYQLEQLPRSMFTVIAAMGGVITSVILLRKYLEQSPIFRRVMLVPPEGEALIEREQRESIVHYDHLLGQRGHCTTPLSPSGKADFNGKLFDVVSEGEAVSKGAEVTVVDVAGNRVVVRQV